MPDATSAAPAAVPGWLLVVHVLGVLGYAGSLVALSRLLVLVAGADPSLRAGMASLGRRVYLSAALPAALLMIATGVYLLVADPAGKQYFKGHNGYMHVKLTVVAVLLIVDHLLVLRPLKDLARGGAAEGKRPLFLLGHATVLLLVFAVLMALFVVRPA